MSQKIKIVFLAILALMLMNCNVVFADAGSDFDYVLEHVINLSSFKSTENYETAVSIMSGYTNLCVASIYSYTYPGSQGDQVTNRTYYTTYYFFASDEPFYYEPYNYDRLYVTNCGRVVIELNHSTGSMIYRGHDDVPSDQVQNMTDSTRTLEFTNIDIYNRSGNLKYPANEIYKSPYFEFAKPSNAVTTVKNVDGNVNCYYKSNLDDYVNSYSTNKIIGYLYIDSGYIWSDLFSTKMIVTKTNLDSYKTTEYAQYNFYKEGSSGGYDKYVVTLESSILSSPYLYTITLTSLNYELHDDQEIHFILLNENGNNSGSDSDGNGTIVGPIVTPSGDILSGDIIKDNTTAGDISNKLDDIFKEPNEEELKQSQEDNINQIKDDLTNDLKNNEIMGALTTAEQGYIELLQGEPRGF